METVSPRKEKVPPRNVVEVSSFYDGTTDQTSDLPRYLKYACAVASAQGKRGEMEDCHVLLAPFDKVHGQGFFAVFDGHEGSHAADFCSNNFHECLRRRMRENPTYSIIDIFTETYHEVDTELCQFAKYPGGTYKGEENDSGCTAVTAFLRLEGRNGKQLFLQYSDIDTTIPPASAKPDFNTDDTAGDKCTKSSSNDEHGDIHRSSQVQDASESFLDTSVSSDHSPASNTTAPSNPFMPRGPNLRKVLYCVNAGNSHGVLCRDGQAIRMTEEHNTKNEEEAKRLREAGRLAYGGRIYRNGVTRSFGDPSVKYCFKDLEPVSPHTFKTKLRDEDGFVILASDGLWNTVKDQEAVDLIRDVKDPKAAADKLIEKASIEGSEDNATVVVIRLRDPQHDHEQRNGVKDLLRSISKKISRVRQRVRGRL